jgi:hypothetical protein
MLEMNARVERCERLLPWLTGMAAAPRSTPPHRLIVGAILPKLSQRSNVELGWPGRTAICPDIAHDPAAAGAAHA